MKNKIPPSYQIETPRFRLRMPAEKDIPFVFSATRYEGFNEGMLWEPPDKEEDLLEPLQNNILAWEEDKGYAFTIEEKETAKPLARISIRRTQAENIWNVGFWTHPESQGKGVMTESLTAILHFGFEELSAERIEACHAIWNKASEQVLKRNGLTFESYIEKGFQKKGKWIAENLLVLDKKKWKELNNTDEKR